MSDHEEKQAETEPEFTAEHAAAVEANLAAKRKERAGIELGAAVNALAMEEAMFAAYKKQAQDKIAELTRAAAPSHAELARTRNINGLCGHPEKSGMCSVCW